MFSRWPDETCAGCPTASGANDVRRLLADAGPPLALMPATRDLADAHTLMRDYADGGVEGVVAKHREHGYRPRRRSWVKVRTRTTADAVVGGVIGPSTRRRCCCWGCPMTPDGCGWRAAPDR
jgi:hypothetical protein